MTPIGNPSFNKNWAVFWFKSYLYDKKAPMFFCGRVLTPSNLTERAWQEHQLEEEEGRRGAVCCMRTWVGADIVIWGQGGGRTDGGQGGCKVDHATVLSAQGVLYLLKGWTTWYHTHGRDKQDTMGGVVWQCMLEYWSCALLVREERTDGGRGVADNKASGNAVSEYQPVTYPRRHPCHHWSPKSIFIIHISEMSSES